MPITQKNMTAKHKIRYMIKQHLAPHPTVSCLPTVLHAKQQNTIQNMINIMPTIATIRYVNILGKYILKFFYNFYL